MNLERIRQALEQLTDAELLRLSPLAAYGRMSVIPHSRQKEFLDLECEEALYGGACGGGKTQALLLYLAEGVKIPEYSGIFFRKTYTQLQKSNDSPITKSHAMFRPLGGKFNSSKHQWKFPSGATIEFGHLPHEGSELNYQGPAYHRVAFDELTQFSEHQYTYLFSRMRMLKAFPIRMGIRAASNPGGPGHSWVKARFISADAEKAIQAINYDQPSPKGFIFWSAPNRAFVPARVADNPSLDIEDYITRMRTNLSTLLRQRLLNGDWSAVEDAAIRIDWLRYYKMQDQMIIVMDVHGRTTVAIDVRKCRRFASIDTAGTSQDKADQRKGKEASWSVIQIWDYWGDSKFLFLRDVWRDRVNWNDLKANALQFLDKWKPEKVLIENAHFGPPLQGELRQFRTELVSPIPTIARGEGGKPGKLERATDLLNKLERAEIYLPYLNNTWLPDLIDEWTAWTGTEGETSDQVDAAAYAARHACSKSQEPVYLQHLPSPRYRGRNQ